MRPHRALVAALAGLGLLLAACGEASEESPPAAEDVEDTEEENVDGGGEDDATAPTDVDEGGEDDAASPTDLEEFTDLAIEAAAAERGVAEEEIEVLRAEEVDWPDGARGCPKDGEMYTQAIVPGYRVVLDVEGEERHYHGAEDEAPFYCEDPQSPAGS